MLKKIKKLSVSSIAILLVLVIFGGIALVRTASGAFYHMRTSGDGAIASLKHSLSTFSSDYEQKIPHEKRLNALLYYTTGIFNSNDVIWGKEDWLFYSATNSGDPIADYTGTNSYTQQEMETAKTNMLNMQKELNDKNIRFCLLIPPNKENVYAQYMPDKYQHTEKTRTDTLVEYLAENGVNAVNPKQALLDSDDQYRTYYKLDTHWNELGAYIGTRELLRTFGTELPSLKPEMIEKGDQAKTDLSEMIGMTSVFEKDYGFKVSGYTPDQDSITEEELGKMTHYHNDKAQKKESLLLIGDSFRKAMIPILSTVYTDFYVVHREDYQSGMLDGLDPDSVVLQIVERHSNYTMDFSL